MLKGRIHSIESMGLVDGPGIRSVVFMQGCRLRCSYCHNPDMWDNALSAKEMSSREVAERLSRFKPYYGATGGVTLSGGEPLLQLDFVDELFKLLQSMGIHTCLDTSGVGYYEREDYDDALLRLLSHTNLVLLDIKHHDPVQYKHLTGCRIDSFERFLGILKQTQVPIWIRHVVVPSLTDGDAHIKALRRYIAGIPNIQKIELLPYHTLGVTKYKGLNIPYPLEGIDPPTDTEMAQYNRIMQGGLE